MPPAPTTCTHSARSLRAGLLQGHTAVSPTRSPQKPSPQSKPKCCHAEQRKEAPPHPHPLAECDRPPEPLHSGFQHQPPFLPLPSPHRRLEGPGCLPRAPGLWHTFLQVLASVAHPPVIPGQLMSAAPASALGTAGADSPSPAGPESVQAIDQPCSLWGRHASARHLVTLREKPAGGEQLWWCPRRWETAVHSQPPGRPCTGAFLDGT